MSDEEWREEAAEMVRRLPAVPRAVAEAMRSVPRHRFVESSLRSRAYDDEPLPLPFGLATISAPHMVALQLEWAELAAGQRVLEIGSGSGYLLALVSELVGPGGRAIGIEIDPGLARSARERLTQLGYAERVKVIERDGRGGSPDDAPFDRILVSFATPEIFPEWRAQVKRGGTVLAPVGGSWQQTLLRWRNSGGEGRFDEGPACMFVPIRGAVGRHI